MKIRGRRTRYFISMDITYNNLITDKGKQQFFTFSFLSYCKGITVSSTSSPEDLKSLNITASTQDKVLHDLTIVNLEVFGKVTLVSLKFRFFF